MEYRLYFTGELGFIDLGSTKSGRFVFDEDWSNATDVFEKLNKSNAVVWNSFGEKIEGKLFLNNVLTLKE
jgi:hypothetical protein